MFLRRASAALVAVVLALATPVGIWAVPEEPCHCHCSAHGFCKMCHGHHHHHDACGCAIDSSAGSTATIDPPTTPQPAVLVESDAVTLDHALVPMAGPLLRFVWRDYRPASPPPKSRA